MYNEIDKFNENGSRWILSKIVDFNFEYYGIQQLHGGNTSVDLPTELLKKKACINVKNKGNKCFLWALLSAKFPASSHSDRLNNYKLYENVLNDKRF